MLHHLECTSFIGHCLISLVPCLRIHSVILEDNELHLYECINPCYESRPCKNKAIFTAIKCTLDICTKGVFMGSSASYCG